MGLLPNWLLKCCHLLVIKETSLKKASAVEKKWNPQRTVEIIINCVFYIRTGSRQRILLWCKDVISTSVFLRKTSRTFWELFPAVRWEPLLPRALITCCFYAPKQRQCGCALATGTAFFSFESLFIHLDNKRRWDTSESIFWYFVTLYWSWITLSFASEGEKNIY